MFYINGKITFTGKGEVRIPINEKEYLVNNSINVRINEDRTYLETIDGLNCNFLWNEPTALDIASNKIDFKQGEFFDIKCNQEYTQEGDKLYFDSGWIIDIDPSITYTDTATWNGSFYDTSTTADGENITLTKELRDDNFNEEAQVSTGINMTGNVLLLHMNDGVGNGGTVVDTSGEGNDGTATFDGSGTCSGINGKFDTACNFDGTTDRITISDDNSLDLNNNFTMSAWVKFSDTTGSQRVISKHDGTTNRYFMRLDNGNKMLCAYAGTEYTYCDVSYSADTWYHLACVLDEDNMAYAYIDGNLQCNKTVTPEAVGAGDVTISSYSGAGEFFNGVVDEVAIWNRSFSQTEITNSYNRGALTHGSYTSLVEDAGASVNWTNITWSSTEPSATINISVQVRSCDDPACSGESWSSFYYGAGVHHNLTQPVNQYFQYNVSFDSNDASNISLSLEDLTLAWRATITDEEYPVFSNYAVYPANNTAYTFGGLKEFNVTIISTNGSVGLEFNGVNYSVSNLTSSLFNRTIADLSVGSYAYKWWAYGNGTLHNFNVSEIKHYTIAQATGSVFSWIDGARANATRSNNTAIWLNASREAGDATITLEIDGTALNSSATLDNLGNYYHFNVTGNHNITATINESENYTRSTETWWINITLKPTITNAQNFTIYQNESIGFQFTASGSVDSWYVNDTTYFKINKTGYFENATLLDTIFYHEVNISVNDTSGNYDSTLISVNVTKAPSYLTFKYFNSADNNNSFDGMCFLFENGVACFNSSGWIFQIIPILFSIFSLRRFKKIK